MNALATAGNPKGVNGVALAVLIALFLLVTVMGFMASRWRRGTSMESLDEWGLGGRSFGTWVTWFLLGGDLYTAYTSIAVPAAMFALGSVNGFFAVPYTIVLSPIIFIFMSRLWSVSHRHGFVTTADFVGGRYGSRGLSLVIAVTGILATMPYIALQLVGIQAVLEVAGVGGSGVIAQDLPLFIAFAVLAAYTYSSGLRAPAVIAFVKDALIYLVIIVAVVYIPSKVGGWDHIFAAAQHKMITPNKVTGKVPGAYIPPATQYWAYATLALGSALALFMYPHSITATLSSKSRNTIRRNAAILPAYSFVLGLLALLGWVAIAAGTKPIGLDGKVNPQRVVPQLFEDMFPSWFAGVALRGHCHRRPSACSHHGDLGRQPVHPQHLPGLVSAVRNAGSGGQGWQDRLARGQVRGTRLRPDHRQAERHQLPAPRRHLDPADVPGDRLRPVPPLVPPLGPDRRLGDRHDLQHRRGIQRREARTGWRLTALRWLGGDDSRSGADGLHRPDCFRDQRDPGRGADSRAPGDEDPCGHGRHNQRRLLRRRRRPAGPAVGREPSPGGRPGLVQVGFFSTPGLGAHPVSRHREPGRSAPACLPSERPLTTRRAGPA